MHESQATLSCLWYSCYLSRPKFESIHLAITLAVSLGRRFPGYLRYDEAGIYDNASQAARL